MGLASQKFFNAADGCWYEVSNSREWHEEDHPRASDGRFTDGEKGESSEEKSRKEKTLIKEFRDLQKVKYDLLKPSETLSRQAKYSEQGKKAYEEWHQKVRDLDKRIDEVKSKIDEMNKSDKKGQFISSFSDVRNLTGTIDPTGEHFETKFRTAEHRLSEKRKFLEDEIKTGKYDKTPSVKRSMETLVERMEKELDDLRSLKK